MKTYSLARKDFSTIPARAISISRSLSSRDHAAMRLRYSAAIMIASTVASHTCCTATEVRPEKFPDQLSAKRHFKLSHCPKEGHLGTRRLWRAGRVRRYHAWRGHLPAPIVGWPARHRRCRIAHCKTIDKERCSSAVSGGNEWLTRWKCAGCLCASVAFAR